MCDMNTDRDIPNFPGYTVDRHGRVFSRFKRGPGLHITDSRREVSQATSGGRKRLRVTLYKNEKPVSVFVHRLVLEAFVGPCPTGMECCHEDGDEANNCLGNLKWGTRKDNEADKKRHGTASRLCGQDNPMARLTIREVKKIRRLASLGQYSQREIAAKFRTSQGRVSLIVRGESWRQE